MVPFIRPEIFPNHLLPLLARHFKNPAASSDTDTTLALALKQFDQQNDKSYIFEIPYGSIFRIHNGKIFKKVRLEQSDTNVLKLVLIGCICLILMPKSNYCLIKN